MTHPVETFDSLGLAESLLKTIEKLGYTSPTPIQQEVIPLILSGADVVGQAQTGTGKTAAFGLPSIQLISQKKDAAILVMTPTRELASQVADELHRLGSSFKIKVATICGGKSFKPQIDAIRHGAQIIVATPGRLLDLMSSKNLSSFHPSIVIIDEADEMLDMGFLEDIQTILTTFSNERQTLLFSATMPTPIRALIQKILKNPLFVKTTHNQTTNSDICQSYCLLNHHERDDALIRLLKGDSFTKSLVFCTTKREVDRVSEVLAHHGFGARALHGDMKQAQRDQVIDSFRRGKLDVLVATDVAARGINIVDVSHVINYHIPFDAENYVHRIGRTGRAGKKGTAITLVTPGELNKLLRFGKFAGGALDRSFVPSKNELKTLQTSHLVKKILDEEYLEEYLPFVEHLKEKMDLSVVTCKLLAMVIKQKPIQGPDEIGIRGSFEKKSAPSERRGFDKPRNTSFRKKRDFNKKSFRHKKFD